MTMRITQVQRRAMALLLCALAGAAACKGNTTPATFAGAQVPADVPAPTLHLAEHGGRTFDLAAEKGKVVLVFFGYTNCPDICPTTLATWSRAKKQLGADTSDVRFVFVTVDPARDTPEVAQRYARQFDPSFVGLSGSPAELETAQKAFRVTSYQEPSPMHANDDEAHGAHGDSYTMAHASRVFVIGRDGRWRLILPASASVETMLGDVRALLAES